MKLVVTSFLTGDGIVEAPGFDEHRSGRNAWALRVQNEEDREYNKAQAISADAFMLGRRTWQIWAAFWPTASGGDPELTEQMNRIPKYRLQVYPVILGSGKRLFRDRIDTHHLRLVGSRTFSSGVVLLTYAPNADEPIRRGIPVDERAGPVPAGSGRHRPDVGEPSSLRTSSTRPVAQPPWATGPGRSSWSSTTEWSTAKSRSARVSGKLFEAKTSDR